MAKLLYPFPFAFHLHDYLFLMKFEANYYKITAMNEKRTELIEVKEFTPVYHARIQALMDALVSEPLELTEEYLKELIASESSHLFLLHIEEEVAGMITVGLYKCPTGTKAWIEDVVIDESYRSKGLGRFIMQEAISFAKVSGAHSLMLTSRPSRVAANKLYQSLGFEQRETNVYKISF